MKKKLIFFHLILCFVSIGRAQIFFRHVASDTNIINHATILDHPQLNGNPNIILQATADYQNVYNSSTIGVRYDGSRWAIVNADQKQMPAGIRFNVMAELPGENHFVHTATMTNTGMPNQGVTLIDHPKLNNNASAILLVTQNFGAGQAMNDSEVAVWYIAPYWRIYNENKSNMPAGAAFNVFITGSPTAEANVHRTSQSNIWGTVNSASETDYSDANKLLFITHNGNQSDWNPNPTGVYYPPGRTKWSVLTGNAEAMRERVGFNILAALPSATEPEASSPFVVRRLDKPVSSWLYDLQSEEQAVQYYIPGTAVCFIYTNEQQAITAQYSVLNTSGQLVHNSAAMLLLNPGFNFFEMNLTGALPDHSYSLEFKVANEKKVFHFRIAQ